MKKNDTPENNFSVLIKELVRGLFYISETDAEIVPFKGGKAEAVTKDEILRQTGQPDGTPVEERSFEEIFLRLTAKQDWFGDEENEIAKKFLGLKIFLEQNLVDLKVFKIGRIQLKVYFVGLDSKGCLMGIQTEAVET